MAPEEHTLTSSCGTFERKLWLLPSSKKAPQRLCIFLDGEFYLERMGAASLMSELMAAGRLPPMTCLFVSYLNAEARHHDYTCEPRYGRFVAEDVVGWAQERDASLADTGHILCGLSLSGLASAHTALHYPAVFPYCLCQSGSFWWLVGEDVILPSSEGRFWLSVGSEETETRVSHPPTGLLQEVSQIEGVERAVEALKARGAEVYSNRYRGGHDIEPWAVELGPALRWLLMEQS